MIDDAGYALRDGRIVRQRPGSELLQIEAGGRPRPAFTVPATEQFFLPRLEPSLRSVRVGLGWFGPSRPPSPSRHGRPPPLIVSRRCGPGCAGWGRW